ncbi:MAG TPA: hypothetical protein DIC46_18340 [Porphyromonadaceae bacterium]|jgi:hypothetical protein|nr:hypothetical protein [Porphyromonadaceae bacterium]
MNSNLDIAIVIPAYKSDFFKETFESIINQTDSNFHVYIGNDAGDKKIEKIIYSFEERANMKITYRYFENNLGQTSLTAHWNRCLEMLQNETWIWLFSDDDLMDKDCIKNFRKVQLKYPDISVFKFNSIKFANEKLLKKNIFPERFSQIDFLKIKFNYISESYAVEYIFKKELLNHCGYFPDFPLGWCSDDLFWIKCMSISDIITIPESLVHWRYSGQNISGRMNTKKIAEQKIHACILFMEELIKSDILEKDTEIEDSFFNWIINQYLYLKPNISKRAQKFYFSKIVESLPKTVNRNKTSKI